MDTAISISSTGITYIANRALTSFAIATLPGLCSSQVQEFRIPLSIIECTPNTELGYQLLSGKSAVQRLCELSMQKGTDHDYSFFVIFP